MDPRLRRLLRHPAVTVALFVAVVAAGALVSVQAPRWTLQTVPHIAGGSGGTYYLATNGTDTGACPSSAPCATLTYVASLAPAPGSTVQYDPGTYSMADQSVTLNGTASSPITITGSGLATLERQTPLDNSTPCLLPPTYTTFGSNTQCAPLMETVNSSWVTVEGLTLVGAKGQAGYNSAFTSPFEQGELMFEGPNVITGDVALSDVITGTNMGCVKGGGQGFSVISSTLVNCGPPQGQSYPTYGGGTISATQFHGIYDAGGGAATIQGNTIYGTGGPLGYGSSGYGIHAHGNAMTGTVILSNTVSGSYYAGILQDSGNPVTVSGNQLYSNGWCLTGTMHMVITQNQCDGSGAQVLGAAMQFGNYDGGPPPPCTGIADDWVSKNTFTNQAYSAITLANCSATGPLTVTNDIIDHGNIAGTGQIPVNTATMAGGGTVSYNLYRGMASQTGDGGHSLTGMSPMFANPNSIPVDAHLQAGSPAIDAGSAALLPPGVPWLGSAPDMGAFEFSGTPTATPTQTNTPTITPTPTVTPTPGGPTNTPTATPTVTPTPTITPTPTATNTPVPPPPRPGPGKVIQQKPRPHVVTMKPRQ